MADWTRIACAVERDRHSRPLVDAAASLAKKLHAELTLVHVVHAGGGGSIMAAEQVAGLLAEAAVPLREMASAAGAVLGSPVQVRIEQGHAPAEIVRVAREGGFDLLVLGTRGRHHALFGSTGDKVARSAPCPVLVVRLT